MPTRGTRVLPGSYTFGLLSHYFELHPTCVQSVDGFPLRAYTRWFSLVMIQLTAREKFLAGALLLSILVGVTVRHCRHKESGPPNGSQTIPAAGPTTGSR